jgi:protein O-GlcNAc transferase
MDYILADRFEIAPQSEKHYSERVLRMPDSYICYDPPDDAPAVSPLPGLLTPAQPMIAIPPGYPPKRLESGAPSAAQRSLAMPAASREGHVTFGSFNNPAKLTRQVLETWGNILCRLPRARLILKHQGIGDETVAGRFREAFVGQGVDAGRIELLGWSAQRELLGEYRRIDLALDPFPYNGGLTTCEALWMGVPVITCPGETFAGRHSLSYLSNVGLADEFAARDLSHYVELAVRWANDLDRLAEVRASLRQGMAASPLCDGKRFAANLMGLLRDAWRTWVSGV